MMIPGDNNARLTYCLNVHPGETWAEAEEAIRVHALAVRDRVAKDRPFGLGLRLSNRAARELAQPRELMAFKELLARENLFAFTVNGFPYGDFSGRRVKESVYAPDWRAGERLDYTLLLAGILHALLPPGEEGSISTVPGSWKPWIRGPEDLAAIRKNFVDTAGKLDLLAQHFGRAVRLALEPEPGCLLETTPEAVEFFGTLPPETREYVGVCLDACHAAVSFEEPLESLSALLAAGVRVAKVQLSSALRVALPEGLPDIAPFDEPVYLHQARLRGADGKIASYPDLPDFFTAYKGDPGELRVHFHVPLFFEGRGALGTTAESLSPDFFRAALKGGVRHFEIETYSFGVLPPEMQAGGVVSAIAREYEWVLTRIPQKPSA